MKKDLTLKKEVMKMSDEPIKVGSQAPDFALKNHKGEEIKLSDYRGKKVILSFHPMAWTGVCQTQMELLEKNRLAFRDRNAVALGISVDSVPSKKAWAAEIGIEDTDLLSDFWPHGEVAKKFGVFKEDDGIAERANIIIDEEGKVQFVKVYPINEVPDFSEILQELED